MDIKDLVKDPVVRAIMADTITQRKMEGWALALMTNPLVTAGRESERDCAFGACDLLLNILRQIIQPRVVSKYKQEEED